MKGLFALYQSFKGAISWYLKQQQQQQTMAYFLLLKSASHLLCLQQAVNFFLLLEDLKYGENYQNMTERQEGSKRCWENGTDRLAPCRVATNQFVKKMKKKKKHSIFKAQRNKMRSAYTPDSAAAADILWLDMHLCKAGAGYSIKIRTAELQDNTILGFLRYLVFQVPTD